VRQQAVSIFAGILLLWPSASLLAQEPAGPPATLLSADQLDNLVAPLALYPDELLGQVLAASTYPIEIVEAQQWMQQNRGLQGAQLMDAAKQQSWDPSVQALVAFPNVLMLLNRDLRWTTDLGNAFLAQQADVMNAVQRLRQRARANGKLASTPQQTVTENQNAIEIQPANPQVVYVPTYNPAYVFGPPAWGSYPSLGYPSFGFGFNPGVLIGAIFSGLMAFGGWGWGLNWLAHGLFLNNLFFGHFGFGGFGGGIGGRSAWVHNPGHRLGVAYPNRTVAGRFAPARGVRYSSARAYSAPRAESSRGFQRAAESPRTSASFNRGAIQNRSSAPRENYRGSASSFRGEARSARPAAGNYKAPRASSHVSAPRASSHAAHYKAPKAPKMSSHSGGHSSGGHSKRK
jgi:hypothetical protein